MSQPHKEAQWSSLCEKVQNLMPAELGTEAWYLIIVSPDHARSVIYVWLTTEVQAAALGTSPETHMLGEFFSYLTKHHEYFETVERQEQLSTRLRDVLFKLLSLVGGPQLLSVLMPLAKAEGDVVAKSEASKLNPKWYVLPSDPVPDDVLIARYQALRKYGCANNLQ